MHKFKYLILFVALIFPFTIFAADLPGAKDPAGIKRYEGSDIVRYEQITFDRYTLPLGRMLKFDFGTKLAEFEKSDALEGEIFRVSYRIPDALRSSLEVFRNYEQDLVAAGWQIDFKGSGKAELGNAFTHIYESLKGHDQLFTYNDAQGHFLVARNPARGLAAALFVTKFDMGLTGNTGIQKGEPIVQLDVIQSAKMEEKMVLVKADEMAKAINESGRISLYGILFDFNKAEVKPESETTLKEIANLLNSDSSQQLLVVGHTDAVGDFEFNRALSQRRAEAVVQALVSKFGISGARLKAFGASFASPVASNTDENGRAKNRRVELVPMGQ
jgi:OmpA-OmpF porin, OOP family